MSDSHVERLRIRSVRRVGRGIMGLFLLSASFFVLFSMTADSAVGASSSDAASSLRAAALLTLKSKRRKNATDTPGPPSLPARPPPSDAAIHLDYGQLEEPPSTVAAPSRPSKSHSPPLEDVQMREEGEISDEESDQPPSPSRPVSDTPTPPFPSVELLQLSRSAAPATHGLRSEPQLSDRLIQKSSPTSLRASPSPPLGSPRSITPEGNPLLVDAEYVRPGVARQLLFLSSQLFAYRVLSVTQPEYDTAKDIVLDLLGWGVHPEYLVDCGLTREIVFHVFHELNLRLPQNLDITGLVPYAADMQYFTEPRKSFSIPPPPHAAAPLNSTEGPMSDIAASFQTPGVSPSSTIKSDSLDAPRTPSAGSLHDMEQQRKQELLARKAAIASRKSKQSTSRDPSIRASDSHVPDDDIHGKSLVLTQTVDDFLKSIDPNSNSIRQDTVDGSYNPDGMNVDGDPGSNAPPSSTREAGNLHAPHSDTVKVSATDTILSSTSTSSSDDQRSANSSASMTRASSLDATGPSDGQHRRGIKRPVAVDFDDFDNGPQLNSHGSSHHGSKRKIVAGFASVSQRRCVIDLSDSEDDGDGDARTHDLIHARRNVHASRATIALNSSSEWMTPPGSLILSSTGLSGVASGGTMSPAALMQKEREIRKMKERIALMEQTRSIKLAVRQTKIQLYRGDLISCLFTRDQHQI